MITMQVTIEELGNGLPVAGDYVQGMGDLYRVVSIDGRVQTGRAPGWPNWVRATVEAVDWSDCEEGDEFPAAVVVEARDTERCLPPDFADVCDVRAREDLDLQAMLDAEPG